MIVRRGIVYQPLESQAKFHASTARFKGFSGPIGSGKSAALCNEALRLAYENPGRTGLMGAPTYAMLRDATQTALFEILGESKIPYDFHKAENQLTLRDTGSRILFRSLDDYERLRGTNLAWFGVDELTFTAEAAWTRLEGRLRDPKATKLGGFAVWTPQGFDWVYERFIHNPVEGYDCVQARPFENRHLLDKIPDFYERLRKSYDETFFAQEVLGQYLSPKNGLVYHAFDRKSNVDKVQKDDRHPLMWSLDFNVNPMSSVVVQVVDGEIRVLDEIVLSRASTEEACREFTRRYPRCPSGLRIYADASASHLQTSGTSDKEIIERYFMALGRKPDYRIPKSNPAVRNRVGLMNAKLKSADDCISLVVHPQCKELIADFERVAWAEGSSEIDKTKDAKRTHLSDALGYLVWQEFQPKQTVGERGQRLFW